MRAYRPHSPPSGLLTSIQRLLLLACMAALVIGGIVSWFALFSAARSFSDAANGVAASVSKSITDPVDVSEIPRQGAAFRRSPLENEPPTPIPTVLGPGVAPPQPTATASDVVAGGPLEEQAASTAPTASPEPPAAPTVAPSPTAAASPTAAQPTATATAAPAEPSPTPSAPSTVPTAEPSPVPTDPPPPPTVAEPIPTVTLPPIELTPTAEPDLPPVVAEGRPPRLVMPNPGPNEIVDAGVLEVNLRVRSDAEIAQVRAAIDEVRQVVVLEPIDEGVWLARFEATVQPGAHRIWVRARDVEGREASFAWEVEAR